MLFVDLFPLSPVATDDVLEFIFKSTHSHDRGIWAPHESILIRRMVELFTQRGLDRLAVVQKAILAWSSGKNHRAGAKPPRQVPSMMVRWTNQEMDLVKITLESLSPAQWTLNYHMMAVEYVVQRYLPETEMIAEAEWLATRASLMGKVQANLAGEITPRQADAVLAAMPITASSVADMFKLSVLETNVLSFGVARAAENVRSITEKVRHRLRGVIMQQVEERMLGLPGIGAHSLETRLVDAFASLNRDWRTIAVTEAGECQLQGLIASLKPGARVKRGERYANACAFCRKLDGRIMTVVSANAANKDGQTQVWVGKTNVGRSASPKKRVGSVLVDRDPGELWWPAAGLQHPNCRGRWVLVDVAEEGGDSGFAEWLKEVLE